MEITVVVRPELNDDGKRRRLWQLKGMDLWMGSVDLLTDSLGLKPQG
ncbi:hypothetical protein QUF58_08890 [Anaerolineales bacterium HSG24]|nr:hypothetical protein [Anaerolineales bacterium HSG24]